LLARRSYPRGTRAKTPDRRTPHHPGGSRVLRNVGTTGPIHVQLTRAQRDAIFQEIAFAFECAADLPLMLEYGTGNITDRVEARDLIWRLQVAIALLDQLGWRETGDRDGYVLEVDTDVDEFAARIERYALVALEDNRRGLLAGSAELRATARRLIDVDLDALGAARTVQSAFRVARPTGD
jgi:hypothetical protein